MMLVIGTAAEARRANDVTTDYYADAARTKWVGSVEYTCGGGIIRLGKVSSFSRKQSDSCLLHRASAAAMRPLTRMRMTTVQACHAACFRKFGIGYCLPDGTCPDQDALLECFQNCDEPRR